MWLLLLCLATYVNSDLKSVVVIQSFNLRTTNKINITCSNIKKILIENTTVTNYNCLGTIEDTADHGMWIITETQPLSPKDKELTWLIEHTSGNITSSFTVDSTLDKPLTTSTNITVQASNKEETEDPIKTNLRLRSGIDSKYPGNPSSNMSIASTTTTVSTMPTTTTLSTTASITTTVTVEKTTSITSTVTMEKTTKTPAPASYLITVTINYLQFQIGQAPVNVNKNTQAVVMAVIEGLLLVAILVVVLVKYYKKSKRIASGQYPPGGIFQMNSTDNNANNGSDGVMSYGSGRGSNTRPQIPSYRTPDTQPTVRLDSLQPTPQQQVFSPRLMPISTPTTDTPAPLTYWPDQQQQRQPVKNIIDSDM